MDITFNDKQNLLVRSTQKLKYFGLGFVMPLMKFLIVTLLISSQDFHDFHDD